MPVLRMLVSSCAFCKCITLRVGNNYREKISVVEIGNSGTGLKYENNKNMRS